MPISTMSSYIKHAAEKEQEQMIFELWKSRFANMTEDTFVSFEDFKNSITRQHQTTNKSYEEIEQEMDKIIAAYEKGGE